jgi:hypothetical protein
MSPPRWTGAPEDRTLDLFYGCLGVAAIILALGAVTSIPSVLDLIERVTLNDRSTTRPVRRPPPPTDGPPWGPR